MPFAIPDDYHYVVASLSLPALILWGQVITVGRYRRRAKIDYPQMYADKAQAEANRDAHLFNCAQRAHQNTMEGLPLIVLSTAITGLSYPLVAAGACTFWAVTRIPFTFGYLSGDPKKRGQYGAGLGFVSNLLLSFTSAYVGWQRLWEAKF
ncbi:membrane-associated proteins in eicosanoid and glutathione metabolism [Macrolepiota fuliginosa MF-IS2]|uniref:Membrane-associated proteins in eicosanoid and glutathione metabolism n=1 Tax=Macrolepiota fuliginosa MF-IS2 TaxID=1400762 RepID=A0A9P5XBH1_9AGAR|nr:membrane-associated proteins in eicosanoid and glutathione metabolism [Macrolepiota fuliginosa MF-IS2]